MAKSKSVLKREKQNEKRRLKNKSVKSEIKTYMKKVITQLEAGELDEAKKSFKTLTSKLDKAAKKNILHKNNVANKKSKIGRKIASAKPKE